MATQGGRHNIQRVDSSGRLNSLGMSALALDELAGLLDNENGGRTIIRRRQYRRWPFRTLSLPIVLEHPGNTAVALKVACRNISSGGLAVLHSAFVYPGSKCRVLLHHVTLGNITVSGTVVRCRHVRGLVHELGVKFDRVLSVRDFVPLVPFDEIFSLEHVDERTLQGLVVHVEASASGARWMAESIKNTGITLHSVTTLADALEPAREGCDVLVTDLDVGGEPCERFIASLDAEQCTPPIILSTPARTAAAAARAAALNPASGPVLGLVRPLQRETLLCALAEVLLIRRPDPLICVHEHHRGEHSGVFVTAARKTGKQLAQAIQRQDAAACRALAVQLTDGAIQAGFDRFSELAGTAVATLGATLPNPAPLPLRRLAAACSRLRAA